MAGNGTKSNLVAPSGQRLEGVTGWHASVMAVTC